MAFEGFKWGAPTPGTSGGVVTWSFDVFPSAIWGYDAEITDSLFQAAIAAAFGAWESVANIDFVYDPGDPYADIVLGWNYIDGSGGTLAVTSWLPSYSVTPTYVEIEFDSAEYWSPDPAFISFGAFHNFYGTALHEIGHAIGLAHNLSPSSIMYAYDVGNNALSPSDVFDIQALYGAHQLPPQVDIYGTDGDDVLEGSNGDDIIHAGAGQDLIHPAGGNDWVLGDAGIDYVFLDGDRQDFFLIIDSERTDGTRADSLDLRAGAGDGLDILDDVERVVFNDGVLCLDIDGDAGQIYRLYQAAFDRTSDTSGLAAWIDFLDRDVMTLKEAAATFIASDEFHQLYGSNVSTREFVTLLYRNVLHRDPDPSGYAAWTGAVDHWMSRDDALVGFSESVENRANVVGSIENGIWLDSALA